MTRKRVNGPGKGILEVRNAIKVYNSLGSFKSTSESDFLKAHLTLMKGLIDRAGKYRNKEISIVKGTKISHIAPPAKNVTYPMKDLFRYLKSDEIPLVKSCVFQYEMEFIHPFMDGNGRMGRFFQDQFISFLSVKLGIFQT